MHTHFYYKLKISVLSLVFLGSGVLSGYIFSKHENSVLESESLKTAGVEENSFQKNASQPVQKILHSTKETNELKSILNKLLKGESPNDWVLELKKVIDLSGYYSSPQKSKNLLILFSKWADQDFDSAMKAAGKLGPDAYEVTKEILTQLAKKDPKIALEYYEQNKDILIKHSHFLKDIAYSWSKKSPEEAFKWIHSLKDETINGQIIFRQSEVLTEFMSGIFDLNDHVLTMKYIREIQYQGEPISMSIIEEWGKRNPDEVVQWMVDSDMPMDSIQMVSAIQGIASKNLKMAEDLLLNFSPKQQQGLVSIIAKDVLIPNQNAEYALNWTIERIPLSEIEDYALSPLQEWSSNDPNGASDWIQKQPASAGKDLAIELYIKTLSDEFQRTPNMYPEVIKLVQSMSDSAKKELLLSKLNEERENSTSRLNAK